MEQLRQASVITSALRPAWSYPHSCTQHANTYCHKIAVSCLQLFPAVPPLLLAIHLHCHRRNVHTREPMETAPPCAPVQAVTWREPGPVWSLTCLICCAPSSLRIAGSQQRHYS